MSSQMTTKLRAAAEAVCEARNQTADCAMVGNPLWQKISLLSAALDQEPAEATVNQELLSILEKIKPQLCSMYCGFQDHRIECRDASEAIARANAAPPAEEKGEQ
jgi:hypothetical protein